MNWGDKIRAMSDEGLAVLFTSIISEREHIIMEKLRDAGVCAELIEFPCASASAHLAWLKSQVEDDADG